MLKFLHAADIHLDSPLKGLERYEGAPVESFRGATRRALENLVDLAIAERVDFVLIAGDLYDGDWNDHGTGLFLNAQMGRLRDAKIPVVQIQGNHDAASQMTRHLALPDNVIRLSTDGPQSVQVGDLDVFVHGQGFATRAVKDNIAAGYPKRVAQCVNIGLLHTSVNGREGHDTYAPCSLEDLRAKAYDYWALGHIHKREILHDDPPIVFPGNIQGRHARELGAKGCTLVTINGAGPRLEHRPLDVLRWEHARVDAAGATDVDEIFQRVADRLAAAREGADGRALAVRVEVFGACPAHDAAAGRHDHIEARVRDLAREVGRGAIWVEKVRILTSAPHPPLLDDGPVGTLLEHLNALKADEALMRSLAEAELGDLRKKLPRELLEADEPLDLGSPGLLRELLDDVGPLLVRGINGLVDGDLA